MNIIKSKKMKRQNYLLIGLVFLIQSCTGQSNIEKVVFNEDFNWTITIPKNFENVSAKEWKKMQNKGADAIEKTFEEEVDASQVKTIFVFRSGQHNYFESNYQPFDTEIDGDYFETFEAVSEILYETFKAQIPGAKIDKKITVENIDNLEFQTLKIKIEYPNKMVMNMLMFCRLFDKKEFTVNIMYVDEAKGKQMLDSWKKSKFTK